ncbi:DUF3794 domain-containing protein [Fuchsiella alkaliacetigena]|uniref:DUF3794 domain-containing protein n=1 Tax=Fuchsiella alkaliacetigena TaxID=957042 RepID=UPI00200A16DB|nr:DUF3794 domain-containing protein [Fuchsiella alkaliacetigena]MCK8824985.1 DUF3794 domain-containing protein [Fuchsiella alkaliacetigena]
MSDQNSKQVKRAKLQQVELDVPAQKIRNITAEVRDITYEVIDDKVIVQGIVHKQIFYVGVDDVVYHRAEDMNFSTFIDVPGAEEGMEAQIQAVVEHVDFELSPDGTELTQKVVLEIFAKITETVQIPLEVGDAGPFRLETVIGEDAEQEIIVNDFELEIPAIKVTEVRAEIRDLNYEVITDKVIIQGTLHKQIFFVGEDDVGYHQQEDIPFSTFVEIEGVEPGMNVQITPEIEAIERELTTPTNIHQKVVVEFFVKATETQEINLNIDPEGELMKLDQVVATGETQTMDVSDFVLDIPAIKVTEVDVTLEDLDITVIANKVIVQGTIHKQIFFVGEDDVEYHREENIPFSTFIDTPGAQAGMQVFIEEVVELAKVQLINETTVHQKVVLNLSVTVTEEVQVNVATGDNDVLIKTRQVVGEGVKQIIVEEIEPIAPPPPPPPPVLGVEVEQELIKEIVDEEAVAQEIVKADFKLCPPAAKDTVSIDAEIRADSVEWQQLNGEFLVTGIIDKDIQYLSRKGKTIMRSEEMDFTIVVPFPDLDPEAEVDVSVEIENVAFELRDKGCILHQAVTVVATVQAGVSEQVFVVTAVEGTGEAEDTIVTETIDVLVPVVVDEGIFTPDPLTIEVDLEEVVPAVVEILDVDAMIVDAAIEFVDNNNDDLVEITGTLVKEVEYLDAADNEEAFIEEIPLEFTLNLADIGLEVGEIGVDFQIFGEIVDLEFEFDEAADELIQDLEIQFFIKITVLTELTVVTAIVEDPFDVIEEVITETLILDIIDDGLPPQPVEVVVDVF